MSKPYDSTMKVLFEIAPADWLRFLGYPSLPAQLIDTDISTVTGATDSVILVKDDPEWVLHIEFQASPDRDKPRKLNIYNAIMEDRHACPVETVLILLRREANLNVYNGTYTRDRTRPRSGQPITYRTFHFDVVRLWQVPPTILLQSVATLPLAPITDVPANELPQVIDAIRQRLTAVTDPNLVIELWTATAILLGLKYEKPFIEALMRGVQTMKESTWVQGWIEQGREQGLQQGREQGLQQGREQGLQQGIEEGVQQGLETEARAVIVRIGRKRFRVEPDAAIVAKLEAIRDLDELHTLADRVLDVDSWDELFAR